MKHVILNYAAAPRREARGNPWYILVSMRVLRVKILAVIVLAFALSATAAEPAPSLDLHDLKGSAHKLEEYRGKPVVLNFWATWCVPCAVEMPLLNEMQTRYKGRIIVIAASIDDDDMQPAVKSFIQKHKADA